MSDKLQFYTLNLGYAEQHADWNWKNVRSPFGRIYYVTAGYAQVIIKSAGTDKGERCIDLYPNNLYFIPPFTMHSYICNGDFAHYYIHVFENATDGGSLFDDWSLPDEVEASPMDLEIIKRLCDINPLLKLPGSDPDIYDNHSSLLYSITLNKKRSLHDTLETNGILYMLLSRFLKYAQEKVHIKDSGIQRTMAYIRRNIGENIKVQTLADMACMSKEHYIRKFKIVTGETPVSYITQRKMERAEMLLITTDSPIKIIADNLGFNDHSYFNRLFKRYVGATPAHYRESNI